MYRGSCAITASFEARTRSTRRREHLRSDCALSHAETGFASRPAAAAAAAAPELCVCVRGIGEVLDAVPLGVAGGQLQQCVAHGLRGQAQVLHEIDRERRILRS